MNAGDLKTRISALTEQEIRDRLRAKRPSRVEEEGLKPSAVLIPLIRKSEGWCLIFTRRSRQLETHKGEISFPGGMLEPGESPLGAALRETREELGIEDDKIHLLGELDEIFTITGFRIRPFVAGIDWPAHLRPNPAEIDSVIILPLAEFADDSRLKTEHWERNGRDFPVYYFSFDDCTVWGATAKMTKNLIERLKA